MNSGQFFRKLSFDFASTFVVLLEVFSFVHRSANYVLSLVWMKWLLLLLMPCSLYLRLCVTVVHTVTLCSYKCGAGPLAVGTVPCHCCTAQPRHAIGYPDRC